MKWKIGKGYEQEKPGYYIVDEKGYIVYSSDTPLTLEDMERIVEAVNAQTDR